MQLKTIFSSVLTASLLLSTPNVFANATEGEWTDVIPLGLVTLHGLVLPDGKVLGFGSDDRGVQSGEFMYSVFDPVTNKEQVLTNTTKVNIFCSNMAIDPFTGDVIIAGGDNSYNGDGHNTPGGQYSGHARVIKFDYTNPSVRDSETGDMHYQRWYGSILTLKNGELLSIGGRNSAYQGSKIPEIYNYKTGYRTLDGAQIDDFSYAQGGLRGTYYYPYVWQASDDDVWMIEPESEGATSDIYRIDVTGNGSVEKVDKMPFKTRTLSPSMMYDVDTVLITDVDGGVWSGDLSQNIPTWEKKFQIKNENNPNQNVARTNATFVPMPDGKVAIVGGSSNAGGVSDSQYYGQASIIIWDPETNEIQYTAKQQLKRLYHSIGLMLPDGRVYTAGGGAPGINRLNAEIFSPPYLFNADGTKATRPQITAAPKNIKAGETVVINVDDASQIDKVTVIKSGSATHGRTADGRVFRLPFTVIDNQTISIDMPTVNILSPGVWFLSTVNLAGVPSPSRIMGVNMVDLQEVPNLTGNDTVIYDIENEEITGPFELTVTARFDALSSRNNQKIFDFGNGASDDNIILGQVGNSADLSFEIYDGNVKRTLVASNAIDEDEVINWKVSVDANGLMKIYKNSTVVAEGQGQVPNNVTRSNKLIGQSSVASDDQLKGMVRSLRITNGGTQDPELPPNKMPMVELELSTLSGTITENGTLPADSNQSYAANGTVGFIDMDQTNVHTATFTAAENGYLGALTITPPTTTNTTTHGNVDWQFTVPHAQIAAMAQGDTRVQTYTITIQDNLGAKGTANVLVTINGSDDSSNGLPITVSPLVLPALETNEAKTFTAVASGGTGALQYKWRFGDGSAQTAYSASNTVSHAYAAPGNYTVVLTVKDNAGEEAFVTGAQAVHLPKTANSPGRSSSIVFDAASKRVWNVNPDNNTVSVFDASNNTKLAEIAVGDGPRSLSIAPSGDVWVSNFHGSSISIIDPASLVVRRTMSLGYAATPYGVVFNPTTPEAYIALEGKGQIVKINAETGVLSRHTTGGKPHHLAVSADGQKLYVSRFITAPITDESTAAPSPTAEEGGEIMVLDAGDLSLISKIYLGPSQQVDTEASARGIPNYLGAPVISPDGGTAWVPSKQDNIFKGMLRDGTDLRFDQAVRAISSKIDLNSDTEVISQRIDHDDSSLATAGTYDRNGTYLFIALETSREVAVIDVASGSEMFRFGAGLAPQGITISEDGLSLYVHNFMGRSVGVYDISRLIQQGQPSVSPVTVMRTVANESLSAQVLRGKQLFYDAADDRLAGDNYMSCASCHSDGGDDGRVWDFTGFGEGLRNTIALNGRGGTRHGLLHWSGNFDEIQDFEGQIRRFAGGSGLMSNTDFSQGTRGEPLGDKKAGLSTDLDALAAYVSSLTRFAPSPYTNYGKLTADAQAGKQVFIEKKCASCHGGANFTRSGTEANFADIGTIKSASGQRLEEALSALDVPTLRDVWLTAPYLHDGSAATLADAVSAHDNFTLSAGELDQVVAYVSQIGNGEPGIQSADTLPPEVVLQQPQGSAGNVSGSIEAIASDPDGVITKVEFYYSGNFLRTVTQAPYVMDWQNVPNGRYALTAKAYDDAGGVTTSNTVEIVVDNTGNTPPVVSLNQPQGSAGNVSGSIEALASDSDGSIVKVEFYYNGNFLKAVTSAPYILTWDNVANGSYSLTAKAYDDAGAVSTSEPVVVEINNGL